MTAAELAVVAARDDSYAWLDDLRWHRRMFAQSCFRWVAEDAMHVLLTYTRGRCAFERPAHLAALDLALCDLRERAAQVQDAVAQPLRTARTRLRHGDWADALTLLDLEPAAAEFIIGTARPVSTLRGPARTALDAIPLPNPLSRAWELRQVHSMYSAALQLGEDVLADLVLELAPTAGWQSLAGRTIDVDADQLRWRTDRQRDARGEPGDPRRQVAQQFATPAPRPLDSWLGDTGAGPVSRTAATAATG